MEPLVVNSGAAALDLIARQSNKLDMILMDITLGDMEGFDVIQTIRRNGVTKMCIRDSSCKVSTVRPSPLSQICLRRRR